MFLLSHLIMKPFLQYISNPVRFLGRSIDVSLCDRQVVSAFKDQVLYGLELINKSFHRGIHKV